jgi:TolB protein
MKIGLLRGAGLPAIALVCTLAACGVRGVQMQESPLLRVLERKHGLIAYEGLDGNIYTIDQAGKNRVQITSDAFTTDAGSMSYGAPTWSFDGRYLGYAMYRSDAEGKRTEGALLLGNRDGSDTRTLVRSATRLPFYLYFAPDSRHLSLLSERMDEPTLELGIFPVRDDGPYVKLDSGAPFTWIWRMDGKSLVEHVSGERLSVITIDPAPVRTDLPVQPGVFQAPDLSPDGKRLLYVTGEPGSSRLVMRTLEGGAETEVAASAGILYFGFSPDGTRVAFLESFSGVELPLGSLSVVTPGAKGSPVRIEQGAAMGFYWSPDSSRIAYFVPSAPEKESDLDEAFALDENAAYLAVMIADTKGKSWLGARFPTTEGFLNGLPYFDQLHRSDTMWSPDGRYFVFNAYAADGKPGLFIASADGNVKARFIDHGANSSWSRR